VLGEGGLGSGDGRVDAVVADGGQDAELVAAEPVGAAAKAHGGRQRGTEPGQQGVPGWMPEGVVVGLEAVEVEQHEQQRPLRAGRGQLPL